MILYDKLKKRYSRKELSDLLGYMSAGRIWRGETNLRPSTISRKIPVVELNYSMEDFFEDYNFLYKGYVEKKMIYSLFIQGISVKDLVKEYSLESLIYVFLKKGFDYNSTSNNLHLTFKELGIETDTSKFTVDLYNGHIEFFGAKEDLEAFKDLYRIKYDIYYEPYKKSWHLAFNGCLAEYIRKRISKE